LTDDVPVKLAVLAQRFGDWLGVEPERDEASSELKVATTAARAEPALRVPAPRPNSVVPSAVGNARKTARSYPASPAYEAELGMLHDLVGELRAGLVADTPKS
jgi:hypothetical protein